MCFKRNQRHSILENSSISKPNQTNSTKKSVKKLMVSEIERLEEEIKFSRKKEYMEIFRGRMK